MLTSGPFNVADVRPLLDLVGYLLVCKDSRVIQMLLNHDASDLLGGLQQQLQLRVWEVHTRAVMLGGTHFRC